MTAAVPQPLPPCVWDFPDPRGAGESEIVAVGADLEPGTLVEAYRRGIFPMRVDGTLAWWSPNPRGIMPLDGFHASRSLRRARKQFSVSVNRDFAGVVAGCADPDRPHGWIDPSFADAYGHLHALGVAHSVEVWMGDELAGGLYGVRIGGLFAGESMFHRVTDASKVAVWATVDLLRLDGATLFDVQWVTDHLASLGAVAVPRADYLDLVAAAVGSDDG
ncbi:MAG: leucyl/phenylalanyl-tRNA--protein transferase [Actinomycetota bacterium]